MGNFTDSALTEASGLAYSLKWANYFYTANDENGPVRCIDSRTGDTVGKCTVKGWTLSDPESISIDGTGALWYADIGDNSEVRSAVAVYSRGEFGATYSTKSWSRYVLRYPSGTPHNAETFLVHPTTGAKYIISKTASGSVYQLPTTLKSGTTNQMTAVHGPDSDMNLVSDGVFSRDGKWVFLLRAGQLSTIYIFKASNWTLEPTTISMPAMTKPEGIGITKDGKSLWVCDDKGGTGGKFQKVPVPAAYQPPGSGGGADPAPAPPVNPCSA